MHINKSNLIFFLVKLEYVCHNYSYVETIVIHSIFHIFQGWKMDKSFNTSKNNVMGRCPSNHIYTLKSSLSLVLI